MNLRILRISTLTLGSTYQWRPLRPTLLAGRSQERLSRTLWLEPTPNTQDL